MMNSYSAIQPEESSPQRFLNLFSNVRDKKKSEHIFKIAIVILLLTISTISSLLAQVTYTPLRYWTFNGTPVNKDSIGNFNLDFSSYGCAYTVSNSSIGKSVSMEQTTGNYISGGNFIPDSSFTIEFMFKAGQNFRTTSICKRLDGAFSVFIGYPFLEFYTTTQNTGDDDFRVTLDGIGKKSYGYLTDGNWHHLVFKYNSNTGLKSIFLDGECPSSFSHSINPGKLNSSGGNTYIYFNQSVNYYRFSGSYDEIALYYRDIPSTLIYKHYQQAQQGLTYSFINNTSTVSPVSVISAPIDINEYAPGHPNPSLNALSQLQSYPLPRFKPGNTLIRNYNWIDLMYLGGRFQSGISDAQSVTNSVNLNYEMAKNWNYMITGSLEPDAWGNAANTLANQNPQWPLSVTTLRAQVPGGAINSQNLGSPNYIQNSSGQFLDDYGNVTSSSNKRWRPTAPTSNYNVDGQYQRSRFQALLATLTRPIDYINEDGEVFPLLTSNAMQQDPQVLADKNSSGLDWETYQGRKFKENETQAYRDQFMNLSQLSNTKFTEYGIDGSPQYRQKWSEARLVNNQINGQYYSTPDFYVRWPNNWRTWVSAWHGWQWIVESRINELATNDKLFSPFVAAGWESDETLIVRPGQWLGLLKMLNMAGAEFFYPGYFNSPSNPGNYVWQVAMPPYAQSTLSRYEDLLRNGSLMNGDVPSNWASMTSPGYTFWAGDDRKMVLARKHNSLSKYAITGTIQPNSNMVGNAELESDATITLDGQQLKFKIRRQGSTYYYDNTTPSAPVFYQLDKWHESTHPSYWSKDFNFEAEVYDNTSASYSLKTTVPAGTAAGDFRNFTTCITFADNVTNFTPIEYNFQPRSTSNNSYYFWVRARSRTGAATGVVISVDNGTAKTISCITDTNWVWYRYDACTQQAITFPSMSLQNHVLRLTPTSNKIEIDQVILSSNSGLILNAAPPSCSGTGSATVTPSGATSFCQGGNVTLTASAGNSYSWSNGATTQAITVNQSGSYVVTVGQTGGCAAVSSPVAITVNPNPTATITANGPTTFCSGGSVVLTASSGSSYLWTPGGQTSPSITVTSAGSYTVKVTNSQGCSATSSATSVTVNSGTSASISAGGGTTFCQGGSVILTANAGNSYSWSNGATSQAISVTNAGNYIVTVTQTGGCSATSTPVTVTVNSNPSATIAAGGSTIFCTGGSVVLTSSSGSSYQWTPGGQTTQAITATASGNYSVKVFNSQGCSATSSATTVTVNTNPTATVTANGPTTFCQGGSVTLNCNAGSSYHWSNGATTQSISVSSAGNYSVSLTTGNCSANSAITAVTVNANPTATITTGGSTSFCQGGSVVLTSSSGSAYLWSNGATTKSITATTTGNYIVTVTNAAGCTDASNATTVTVNALPAATITASGPTTIQQGQSVTLTSSTGTSYLWSPGGQTTQSISVSDSGSYSVTVFNAAGCSSTSAATNVSVSPSTFQPVITASTTSICQGSTATLTATQGTQYFWSTNQYTQSITISNAGTYTVSVSNGTQVGTATITIGSSPTPATPSVSYSYVPNSAYQLFAFEPTATFYNWTNGQNVQNILVSAPGTYGARVKNQYGCFSAYKNIVITSLQPQNCQKPDMLTSYNITKTSAIVGWNPSVTADSFVVRYNVHGTVNYVFKTVAGNISTALIQNLAIGTLYDWKVYSACQGSLLNSIDDSFTTLNGPLSCGSTPYNTSTSNITASAAKLNWIDTYATTFKVRYRKLGIATWTYTSAPGANLNFYQLNNLSANTTYEWSVASICNGFLSKFTPNIQFTTGSPCPNLEQLKMGLITNNSAQVTWSTQTFADSVKIKYNRVGTSVFSYITLATNPGTVTLTNLMSSATYDVYVRSYCITGGAGTWQTGTFTTNAHPRLADTGNNNPLQLNAYPNPAAEKITFAFKSTEDDDYKVMVTDMTGKELMHEVGMAQKGANSSEIDLHNYATGIYMLVVQRGPMISRFKFSVHK